MEVKTKQLIQQIKQAHQILYELYIEGRKSTK